MSEATVHIAVPVELLRALIALALVASPSLPTADAVVDAAMALLPEGSAA